MVIKTSFHVVSQHFFVCSITSSPKLAAFGQRDAASSTAVVVFFRKLCPRGEDKIADHAVTKRVEAPKIEPWQLEQVGWINPLEKAKKPG